MVSRTSILSYRRTVIPSYRHTVIPSYRHTILPLLFFCKNSQNQFLSSCNKDLLPLQYSRLFHRPVLRLRSERGGKSGQQRAPYFLTGRYPRGYSSVTENNRPSRVLGIGIRVKRRGKSSPVPVVTQESVHLMG
jgi:hypothetical protein